MKRMDPSVIFLNNVKFGFDLFLHSFMFVSICSQWPEMEHNVRKLRYFIERSFMSLQVMKYIMA